MSSNVDKISVYVKEIMRILDIKKTEDNEDTPNRVAKMLDEELFINRNNHNIEALDSQMKVFKANNHNMVEVDDINVFSMCSHHWLPFFGKCSVSYIPNEYVIGLSKIPRVIEYFSNNSWSKIFCDLLFSSILLLRLQLRGLLNTGHYLPGIHIHGYHH